MWASSSTAGSGPEVPRVWVSLGSNRDRESSLRGAIRALRGYYGDLVLSPLYESAAVGFAGEPFLNLVAGLDTAESVAELRARFSAIEDAAGRVRGPNNCLATRSCATASCSNPWRMWPGRKCIRQGGGPMVICGGISRGRRWT